MIANWGGMEKPWPELPYEAWSETRQTLHRWLQIIGKIQLALTPTLSHWWNTPLTITARGFATTTLPVGDRWFDVELDVLDDVLRVRVSDATTLTVPLADRPVADFFADVMKALARAGIAVRIWPHPVEIVDDTTPFPVDTRHHSYDRKYVLSFWRIIAKVNTIMLRYCAEFVGKTSPPQFYWGHLDLTVSRFSGRRANYDILDPIEREAYSHELVAVGWWAGDPRSPRPAFYAYAAPEPPGLSTTRLTTPNVRYDTRLRGFYLDYDDVRTARDPDALVLGFFEEAYAAAATLAHWDRPALERELTGARL